MIETPYVISGVTDTGMRYAQIWHPGVKVAASLAPAPLNVAWMKTGEGAVFGIDSECPPAWVDLALQMFAVFRRGDLPAATHTVAWKFGRPEFTSVPEEPSEDSALFEMEIDK